MLCNTLRYRSQIYTDLYILCGAHDVEHIVNNTSLDSQASCDNASQHIIMLIKFQEFR